jgi:hypothetical protein
MGGVHGIDELYSFDAHNRHFRLSWRVRISRDCFYRQQNHIIDDHMALVALFQNKRQTTHRVCVSSVS